ncbi:MAG: HAD family hydrolase [Ktedonobacterales bacterium]
MARFQLVAADLDGTLLDPHGAATAATRAAVRALREAGVTLALATSRRVCGAVPAALALGHSGPLIVYDGALICDYPSGEWFAAESLDRAVAREAADVLAAHRLRPLVQHWSAEGERLIAGPAIPGEAFEARYLARFAGQLTEVAPHMICDGPRDPLRMAVFGPVERLRAAARALRHLTCGLQVLPAASYGAAELTLFSRAASKGAALRTLARRLDISLAATCALGDGLNDLSLFAAAGFSIAMADAPDEVRAAAGVVTQGNKHDGAAAAIMHYVLGA